MDGASDGLSGQVTFGFAAPPDDTHPFDFDFQFDFGATPGEVVTPVFVGPPDDGRVFQVQIGHLAGGNLFHYFFNFTAGDGLAFVNAGFVGPPDDQKPVLGFGVAPLEIGEGPALNAFGQGSLFAVGFTGELNPIPVPAALPLFLFGLGLLGFAGWRRRRKAA